MWHESSGSSEAATVGSSLPSVSTVALRTPPSECSSLATTAAACCASTACSSLPGVSTAALRPSRRAWPPPPPRATASSSLPSVATAALRTYTSESASMAITAAACCASTASSSLPSVSTAVLRMRSSEPPSFRCELSISSLNAPAKNPNASTSLAASLDSARHASTRPGPPAASHPASAAIFCIALYLRCIRTASGTVFLVRRCVGRGHCIWAVSLLYRCCIAAVSLLYRCCISAVSLQYRLNRC
eukprot:4675365-Prymnesium_polylepis.1